MKHTENIYNHMIKLLTKEEMWIALGIGALKILGILLVSALIIRFGKTTLQKFFFGRAHGPLRISERREATLLKLLDNIIRYVVFFIAAMAILQVFSIDVKALLAGAGIIGLAVGFGAQSLVKDVITGFFIILEDQFSVGDYVRIGQFEGTVEEIGLRTSKIKNFTGELLIVPNGNISEVTNFSIHNSVAVVDIGISYDEDIDEAEKHIEELLEEMPEKYEELVEKPQLLGIQNVKQNEIILRVVGETLPMKHWYIARALRKEIKLVLDEHGIKIPYPRMVMYNQTEEK
ncbi:mechanosensitive ion channel family protein [Peribacillus kribbensis]|uniref:mechanosensitive ion channel family protein n=1 Tax=Peribacillus kribbensis TaxID=356658 RepID=UPI0004794FCD|nr:mechanosensitive ion channel family protein [Peribacillus kribbensis]